MFLVNYAIDLCSRVQISMVRRGLFMSSLCCINNPCEDHIELMFSKGVPVFYTRQNCYTTLQRVSRCTTNE